MSTQISMDEKFERLFKLFDEKSPEEYKRRIHKDTQTDTQTHQEENNLKTSINEPNKLNISRDRRLVWPRLRDSDSRDGRSNRPGPTI